MSKNQPHSNFNRKLTRRIILIALILGGIHFARTDELPEDPYQRGLALFKQFKYKEAKLCFDQVITKNPTHKNALYNRGKSLVELNQLTSAMNDFNIVK